MILTNVARWWGLRIASFELTMAWGKKLVTSMLSQYHGEGKFVVTAEEFGSFVTVVKSFVVC